MAITGQNTGDYSAPMDGGKWNACSKSITYVAGTTGAIATSTLFTVTGVVRVRIVALCGTTLTSGGSPTIEVGTAITTAGLLPQVANATGIAAGELWHMQDGTVDASVEAESTAFITKVVSQNIAQKIASATVTAGVLTYYCFWQPLSPDGTVVAAQSVGINQRSVHRSSFLCYNQVNNHPKIKTTSRTG